MISLVDLRRSCLALAKRSIILAWLSTSVPAAAAESIQDVLIATQETNLGLRAQSFFVSSSEAAVGRARAGFLPKVTGSADRGFVYNESWFPGQDSAVRAVSRPASLGIEFTQTIFDGGRTINTVRAAEHVLSAAQADLLDREQSILLEAAESYLDVIRESELLELERKNLANIGERLVLVEKLFHFGDVTEVDVAQVRARLSDARARVTVADGTLLGAQTRFSQIVGHAPLDLLPPNLPAAILPSASDVASGVLVEAHPAVQSAIAKLRSAESGVEVAKAAYMPAFSLLGTVNHRLDQDNIEGTRAEELSLYGRVSIPIYDGGESNSASQEAFQVFQQRRIELDAVRMRVRTDLSRASAQYSSAQERLRAVKQQRLDASRALDGLRMEYDIGQRTGIEVLDGIQDFLSANIAVANAQRDYLASGYNLCKAAGRLSISNLKEMAPDPWKPEVQIASEGPGPIAPRGLGQSANTSDSQIRRSNVAKGPISAQIQLKPTYR